jgi:hypothetical protein
MGPLSLHGIAFMVSNRRKKKLVNIGVQKAIALRIVCHSLLFVWCVLLVCLGLLSLTGLAESGETLVRIRTICLTAIGASTLVILPAIVYDSIKFSHRMAGPVIRLKNILPSIGVEKLDHVRLRNNDFWQEFVTEVNAMLDRVEALRQAAAATSASKDVTSSMNPASLPMNLNTPDVFLANQQPSV